MVVICMPVFNEEEGIAEFLFELSNFIEDVKFVVIDDKSTDKTNSILTKIRNENHLDLDVLLNENNQGHGASTLRGMRHACSFDNALIITIDGDG